MAGFREFQTGEVLTAANVDDFLAKQAVMKFADAAARDTALGTAVGGSNALREGMVAYLDDTNDLQVYNGTAWSGVGYRYAGTRYYTSSGSFAKADPLGTGDIGLRAVKVRAVGAGGGGAARDSGQGGAGGGAGGSYAESFILASALSASETVTRGSGGAGRTGSGGDGVAGGSSSFGSHVVADGGNEGKGFEGGEPGAVSTGDLQARGGSGDAGSAGSGAPEKSGRGGDSIYGGGGQGRASSGTFNGSDGYLYGGGGAGGSSVSGVGDGGNGANGIVIVDCYV